MLKTDGSNKMVESSQTSWGTASKTSLRLPIRWRWTLMVGGVVLLCLIIQFYIFQEEEKNAWLKAHLMHESLHIARLGDDLKGPILSQSPEIDIVVKNFLSKVPDAVGVYLHYANDEDRSFGMIDIQQTNIHEQLHAMILEGEHKTIEDREWYIHSIKENETLIATLVVQFSFKTWKVQEAGLFNRLLLSILIALTISSFLVNWLIRKMSKPIEALSRAAKEVANGNYSIRLPHNGNDEISDAIEEFNILVAELEHKEKTRAFFGRYLNQKLISEAYADGNFDVFSQRQDVTILFADMVAFTSFSESASNHEIISLLNKYFGAFHRIIEYYGGQVDSFMGDAVMAVFNHPRKDPKHPTNAALAGLAIQMATKELAEHNNNGDLILFRVGINRGKAIIGNIGSFERAQYTVIGDPVNVASRIMGCGDGGQVTMSHSTYSKMDNPTLKFNSIGQCEIKGIKPKINCGYITLDDEETILNVVDAVNYSLDISRQV